MGYNVIVAPRALKDLDDVNEYICNTLCSSDAARSLIARIVDSIAALSEFPLVGTKVVFRFHSDYEVRRLVINEFLVFYRVEDKTHTVYILRIRYGRTDYIRHLELE